MNETSPLSRLIDRHVELSQVTESLAKIQTEKHKAIPLNIVFARFEDPFDFIQRERSPFRFLALLQHLHASSWIAAAHALLQRIAKANAPRLSRLNWQSARCAVFRLIIAKLEHIARIQCVKIARAFRAEKSNESVDHAFVTIER